MCLVLIDNWLEDAASGRANIAPEKIPWGAIKTLIKQTVYGGKIDNGHDQALLDSFVNSLFKPNAYDVKFALVSASAATGEEDSKGQALLIPDETKLEKVLDWVNKLPDQQPPTWLGLPSNAEKVLMALKGKQMLSKLRKVTMASEEEDPVSDESGKSSQQSKSQVQQPAWMRTVRKSVDEWLAVLPATIHAGLKTSLQSKDKDPLYRFFERENAIGVHLLKTVRNDLLGLQDLIEGKAKQTNHSRALVDWILKGMIPPHWKKHKSPAAMSLDSWVHDLNSRLAQLSRVSETPIEKLGELSVWIGGLFGPEAFVTATMQAVAQREKWSLEELKLSVIIGDDADGFDLTGLRIEGGQYAKGAGLALSSDMSTKLEKVTLVWKRKDSSKSTSDVKSGKGSKDTPVHLGVPVYLNSDRKEVLFVAEMSVKNNIVAQSVVQQGVALLAAIERDKISGASYQYIIQMERIHLATNSQHFQWAHLAHSIPFTATTAIESISKSSPTTPTTAKRRLMRDFKKLSTDPPEGVSGAPCPDNVLLWNAVIFGPEETPFEDGTFKLILTFDESYPTKPPHVKFVSKMFHPNVYANGDLCLDILQNRWSPTYDTAAILTSIQSLLHDPNPNSPANTEAARLFTEDRKAYNRRVRETVEESWAE
ncbi:hypothetical protein CcCBS67573_g07903 [Chytriomyces confervae]|uniref:UBC core domain-containing protein n=2 Tax=Chytriomyces confervae TaxID=246404 RepID=A0A507ESL9_9FUNG|nr:hypothetical protein CcCBS67573_g07903 [Chytriomyces confervae]